jgi:hypothetical protein
MNTRRSTTRSSSPWTLQVELISKPPAGGSDVGQAEFALLIKFSLNHELCLLDPDSQV